MLQRLSDYFTCWKLKVLLGTPTKQLSSSAARRTSSSILFATNTRRYTHHSADTFGVNQLEQQQEQGDNDLEEGELQLDFSTWRQEIAADELQRKMRNNPLRSQVKVHRVANTTSLE